MVSRKIVALELEFISFNFKDIFVIECSPLNKKGEPLFSPPFYMDLLIWFTDYISDNFYLY